MEPVAPKLAELLLNMKTVQTPGEAEVAKCAEKKKQLLAANKAAARLLLLSVCQQENAR